MKGSVPVPPVGGLSLTGSPSCDLGLLSAVSLISDTSCVQGGVLVSAGIELIFFLVTGTVCFGFSVRIMLITH